MKTMVKLVMLLAVLAICIPAQGEILIYSKLYHCWEAWEIFDGVPWAIDEWTQRGFLVLNVDYDGSEIDEIIDAEQIEYMRDGRNKWYWQDSDPFTIERVDVGDEVIWVIEQLFLDIEPDEVWLIMVRGKAKHINIGLGRDEKREVARVLNGNLLELYLGEGVEKSMCSYSLRLHNRFTRLANDPDECDQNFECAVFGIVKAWLEDRGYVED